MFVCVLCRSSEESVEMFVCLCFSSEESVEMFVCFCADLLKRVLRCLCVL